MASFLSALSILILVLVNGYFTLPVVDELPSPSFSPLHHEDLTTEHPVNLRFESDDILPESPIMEHKQARGEYMGLEMTTSSDLLSKENVARALRIFDESVTSSPSTFTIEKSSIHERDFEDLSFTTAESFTHAIEHERRGLETETEREINVPELELGKRDMPIESSTGFMSSFPTKSSTVIPQLNQLETSTKKYTGLLKDDQSEEVEKVKPVRKPTLQIDDDSKDSSAPIALFDQEASKEISTVPNGVMMLDETNDPIVTNIPDTSSKIKTEKEKEQKKLNQGEESSHSEEKKSDN